MGLISNLFHRPPAPANAPRERDSVPASTGFSASTASFSTSGFAIANHDVKQTFTVRRDLLRLVLRDITTKSGIPSGWLEMHPMAATSRSRGQGIHARIVVRHWQPLILAHAPGLERLLRERLHVLDPAADEWLMDISWQLGLTEEPMNEPLPRPSAWTAVRQPAPRIPQRPLAPVHQEGADVIAGPVQIGGESRDQLERMLAEGDARTRGGRTYDATQPAPLA